MRFRLLLALLVLVVVAACHRKPAIPPDVVVRLGERMITLADLKRYLERNAGTELAQLTPEVASALLDQYVEEVVLSEYAATHGVEVPADKIATAVRNDAGATVVEKRDEMRREKLVTDMSTDVPQPTDDDIRSYYEQHPDEFKSPEEVRVRQILVHDEELANDIAKKLKAGEPFEKLSSEHSVAANAKKGGEIGYLSRGELPKMFEEEIFALKPGAVSNVIRTDGGFHIFKVDERRAAGTIDLQTAEPVIRERLKEESVRQKMSQLVAKSRGEMQIAVLTKRLPFRYSGTLPKSDNE
ncbi:MAG: peptidyl-prolyl cis-trans isomerase [Acidobacteriota bacterium]|jgi:peptidyl-prolyl cis-trans isomerase C/foldase protein PrsA|nr:peptidyl-prolyl cis-trans isomerase [Acidobacteriota bacterium]